ncbi:hypothetical protein [Oscillatoria sp. FACHB-1406]|uniref:hypothetical protein n=1 Tax=Oscillatoria sp. FACHB-1406 TaxID=2692846 RepID=UPI0016863FC4|nr:hypothetical protein [Oscillatoria sp. FACHB-1406]MBD2579711.1 hypothetical protein [Oscillatoria sp. FACHB-1406]
MKTLNLKQIFNAVVISVGTSFLVTSSVGATSSNGAARVNSIGSGNNLIIAQSEQIYFAPGESSASVSGGVPRGTSYSYFLDASGGQYMTVSISSVESNGVFSIIAPDGSVLAGEATSWGGTLPNNGTYQIVVGSTRGGASYTLYVAIQ